MTSIHCWCPELQRLHDIEDPTRCPICELEKAQTELEELRNKLTDKPDDSPVERSKILVIEEHPHL